MNEQEAAMEAAKIEAWKKYANDSGQYDTYENPTIEFNAAFESGFRAGIEYAERWTPVSDGLPEESGYYFATRRTDSGRIYTWQTHFSADINLWSVISNECITAWRPFPQAYYPPSDGGKVETDAMSREADLQRQFGWEIMGRD